MNKAVCIIYKHDNIMPLFEEIVYIVDEQLDSALNNMICQFIKNKIHISTIIVYQRKMNEEQEEKCKFLRVINIVEEKDNYEEVSMEKFNTKTREWQRQAKGSA